MGRGADVHDGGQTRQSLLRRRISSPETEEDSSVLVEIEDREDDLLSQYSPSGNESEVIEIPDILPSSRADLLRRVVAEEPEDEKDSREEEDFLRSQLLLEVYDASEAEKRLEKLLETRAAEKAAEDKYLARFKSEMTYLRTHGIDDFSEDSPARNMLTDNLIYPTNYKIEIEAVEEPLLQEEGKNYFYTLYYPKRRDGGRNVIEKGFATTRDEASEIALRLLGENVDASFESGQERYDDYIKEKRKKQASLDKAKEKEREERQEATERNKELLVERQKKEELLEGLPYEEVYIRRDHRRDGGFEDIVVRGDSFIEIERKYHSETLDMPWLLRKEIINLEREKFSDFELVFYDHQDGGPGVVIFHKNQFYSASSLLKEEDYHHNMVEGISIFVEKGDWEKAARRRESTHHKTRFLWSPNENEEESLETAIEDRFQKEAKEKYHLPARVKAGAMFSKKKQALFEELSKKRAALKESISSEVKAEWQGERKNQFRQQVKDFLRRIAEEEFIARQAE